VLEIVKREANGGIFCN